tara:strand:+ start:24036 stop:25220 length:1185 start_codon:yes stop_codon:yes gene_type:complete
MKYCKKCVTPDTRPDLEFNKEGICSACQMASKKLNINWEERKKNLESILNSHRRTDDHVYDCIVPVSGGKDSIYQTYMAKNVFNMNPLCITWRSLARTNRGQENLNALRSLGVDHIDFTSNPSGINKITRLAFEEFGDCSLVDHLAIYNLIPNLALRLNIPLIIWGENPYMEYGGDKERADQNKQSNKIVRENHILKGKATLDWVSKHISRREINSFVSPDEQELDLIDYEPIYLGFYIPWDAKKNKEIAIQNGFKPREKGPIMGIYDYADLDCINIVIHHYFKWLKFGFNRITDNASNEIRKGRMTREEAIEMVKKFDGFKPPVEYIKAFCSQIRISEKFFWEIGEKFRNKKIWKKNEKQEWYISDWIGGDKIPDKFPHTKLSSEESFFLSKN